MKKIPRKYLLLSITQRPRYENPYAATHAEKPRTMTGLSGNAMLRKPPACVQSKPIFSITKKPLTARYTIIEIKIPT